MKVYLDTIGCRLNQSEIEIIGRQFRTAGHTLVEKADDADLAIINTCAVTKEAASDSRQKTRQAYRAGSSRIIVTGCWATIDPEGAKSLPGVTKVISNLEKENLVPQILHISPEVFDQEPIIRYPLPGIHARTRAFIKVQDGCDNHCTFCITRIARGPSRSQPVSQIMKDIHAAERGGVKEIVLSGVHLASWGKDFSQPSTLRELIATILKHSSIPRIRLSSLEPWDLDEAFFELWQNPRLCRHLHLPLQSGALSVIKRMGRKNTPDSFERLVTLARTIHPDMAISTDIIAGFPGESEIDFKESMAFLERIRFSAGHIFSFSSRPGTPAAQLQDVHTRETKKTRNRLLREIIDRTSREYREAHIGQTVEVLWESADVYDGNKWRLHGLSDNYIRVTAEADREKHNTISRVRLKTLTPDGMSAVLLEEE